MKVSHEELQGIHSAVLRQIAVRTVGGGSERMSPHDSHRSNHSKNSIVFTEEVDVSKARPETAGP
jgi:hypothetical protein